MAVALPSFSTLDTKSWIASSPRERLLRLFTGAQTSHLLWDCTSSALHTFDYYQIWFLSQCCALSDITSVILFFSPHLYTYWAMYIILCGILPVRRKSINDFFDITLSCSSCVFIVLSFCMVCSSCEPENFSIFFFVVLACGWASLPPINFLGWCSSCKSLNHVSEVLQTVSYSCCLSLYFYSIGKSAYCAGGVNSRIVIDAGSWYCHLSILVNWCNAWTGIDVLAACLINLAGSKFTIWSPLIGLVTFGLSTHSILGNFSCIGTHYIKCDVLPKKADM